MYPKQLDSRAVQRVCGSLPTVRFTKEVMITTYNMSVWVANTAKERGNLYPKARHSELFEFESMPSE